MRFGQMTSCSTGRRRRAGAVGVTAVLLGVTTVVLPAAGPAGGASPPPIVLTTTFPHPSTAPPARVFDAAATAADGVQSVVYGGQLPSASTNLGDTWTYTTAAGWTARCGTAAPATTACLPGLRSALGMGTGPNGPVLYGGFRGSIGADPPLDDTWVWNGTTWAESCTHCAPGGRAFVAMAGNGTEVVLFGGLTERGLLSDTWVFDGTTWTQTCGAPLADCGPPGLAAASMAWDGTRFVLFGGSPTLDSTSTVADDTWTFDGTAWTKVCGTSDGGTACGPPARALAAFSFAPHEQPDLRGALLMQGGNVFSDSGQYLLRDAWLWHAGTWTQVTAPWDGSPVPFTGSDDNPMPGPDPLLGVAAARPNECEVLYFAAGLTTATRFDSHAYLAGRDLTGRGTPSPCTVPPAVTTTAATPAVAGTATTASPATIARTGSGSAGPNALVALACIGIGGTCVLGARRRGRRPVSS